MTLDKLYKKLGCLPSGAHVVVRLADGYTVEIEHAWWDQGGPSGNRVLLSDQPEPLKSTSQLDRIEAKLDALLKGVQS